MIDSAECNGVLVRDEGGADGGGEGAGSGGRTWCIFIMNEYVWDGEVGEGDPERWEVG